jgi:1-deoxy-D-xylulose-5-phosphate synthase
MKLLDNINYPKDIKNLTYQDLDKLAAELREFVIETLSKNGGHLASNLGVVELTLALDKVFDLPKDKIVWDVGHQAYIHKILTGRKEEFKTIRKHNGLSGFPKIKESEYDSFGTGHSSTSISAALGIALARDLNHEDYNVIGVIGDGALTGGMSFEALNHAAVLKKKLIIILNDNEMSISKNVGAMSEYLYRIRTDEVYSKAKKDIESLMKCIPSIGDQVVKTVNRVKDSLKYFLVPGMLFEDLGLTYLGPIDGHNIKMMTEVFEKVKEMDKPVVVHVITKKGKGYAPAEKSPDKFHGTSPFDIATGIKIPSKSKLRTYTSIFSETLVDLAKENDKIVAITAAMQDGTGLTQFANEFPNRFFDVGIAEQHAVTLAAGIATKGYRPVVAIYSTFLQRAFDQVLHDVCMQNLPVTFCLDRAGIVGDDGYTHHGVFDISYLRLMPNMTLMAPKDEVELADMMNTSLSINSPVAIRYPRGNVNNIYNKKSLKTLEIGKGEIIKKGKKICLISVGSMFSESLKIIEILEKKGFIPGLVNLRFIKPIDGCLLDELANEYDKLVVLEENVLIGGAGSAVLEYFEENNPLAVSSVLRIGIPDTLVNQGDRELLLEDIKLDAISVANKILKVASDIYE